MHKPSGLANTLALLAAVSLTGVDAAWAQISNGSAAGTVAAAPSGAASATGPVGPGKSILPLTTPQVVPYENTVGVAPAGEKPGSTGTSDKDNQAYGTGTQKWPYSAARVAVTGAPYAAGTNGALVPVASRPYRYTGKLWMRYSDGWYVCTASLIKKGVLITAAHCVHNYGKKAAGWALEVRWYPANWSAAGGPWSYYQGATWRIPTPYFNGVDTCQAGAIGIVCNNDIATVTLTPKRAIYAGAALGGWYGYGWNGYSYITSPTFGNALIGHLTQLGYPVAIDSGYQMERNDAYGKYVAATGANGKLLRNTQLGSPMTGGSSGGPWMVNFGTRPTITGSASLGAASSSNIVVGVTSWGYTSVGINVQGASWFGQNAEYPSAAYGTYGAGNIGKLVQDTCTASPAYC